MTNNEMGPGKADNAGTGAAGAAASNQAEPLPFIPGQRKRGGAKLKVMVVALITVGALATCATIYMQRMYRHHQEEKLASAQKPKDSQADSMVDINSQKERIRRQEAEDARRASDAAAASAALAIPAGVASQPVATTAAPGASGQAASAPITPEQRRLSGDVAVAFNTGHEGTHHGKTRDPSDADGSRTDAKGSAFDDDLRPSQLKPMRASFRTNRSGLLSRNTTIRCVQDTAIITDYPGLIGCTVAEDVWSDDGSTLLIRKGAEAKGEQRKAVLQGQGRIFTIWNEIDDGNVKITLDSPGTDALGASGQAAYVDEHFWLRFKGALMVSLVGDFGQALANKTTSGGNNTISFSNSSNATQEVAADTLRSTINIPPTAYSNQGSIINIFVARDVDLSGQYENVRADGTLLPPPAQ